MSCDCSLPHSHSHSHSSPHNTITARQPAPTPLASTNTLCRACSGPCAHSYSDKQAYLSASYKAKGKRTASRDKHVASPSDDIGPLTGAFGRASFCSTSAPSPQPDFLPCKSTSTAKVEPTSPALPSSRPPDQERRVRRAREGPSRSLAPSPLRAALNTSPTTSSASQFVSLLGQPIAVSASLSSPTNESSAVAKCAVIPSLYKASRGRSTNVSPSRRWDRRGASATVLSGASASGSGGEADEPSDSENANRCARYRVRADNPRAESSRSSIRRLSVPKEEALFPSDDDETPPFSPTEEMSGHTAQFSKQRRRPRRWSSVERDRSRGMRILLQESSNELHDSVATLRVSRSKAQSRGRPRSTHRVTSATEEDASDMESSSLPSSCTSSCDLDYLPKRGQTIGIPIKEHRSRSSSPSESTHDASLSATSSQGQVPSSTDGSDDPSPAASTPSTSLVQQSCSGFTTLKPIAAISVTSDSDPLLGLATPSIEDMIQIDQVEFFPEEAITAQLASAQNKRKTSPKRTKISSWIIGDFESEPETDEDPKPAKASLESAVNRSNATAISISPPSSSPSSYQARLASLQSQLRIWSRTQDPPAQPRSRQTSAGSEDHTDAEAEAKEVDSNNASLLSASWRNLTRLPNLILLPGLAARQARESLVSASKTRSDGLDSSNDGGDSSLASDNEFAQIYRLASSAQGMLDEKTLQAQRQIALKTGRPPSPSPSPSPPSSLLGSRQSSNDSISTTERISALQSMTRASRSGRGVASPLEADRDPSAYVSGLGQPIDPDTELSSVVQLQTFRSRSRSRPADPSQKKRAADEPRSASPCHSNEPGGYEERHAQLPPVKLGQAIELESTSQQMTGATFAAKASGQLTVQIPPPSIEVRATRLRRGRQDVFGEGRAPTDIASAPTSPTYRQRTSSSSTTTSGDDTDSALSPSSHDRSNGGAIADADADGFRVVRRRHRRRSSGPRSLRPKVEALVPHGYSAFAIKEGNEHAEGSDSDGETTPSPTPARRGRGGRGRASSPRRSTRQCAVGLFGGGMSEVASSTFPESSLSSSRSRRSGRSEASHLSMSSPIRSVQSSPDLTYAAAAAAGSACEGGADGPNQIDEDPSPPRGSRGRRGAVKVVASSVGQRAPPPQTLLLSGMEGLRRGPSYPPRAGERLEDGGGFGSDFGEDEATSAASGLSAQGGRGRMGSSGTCGGVSPQPLRFRLLSNSSHLLMLSLELAMIKKQKISAPLKPRWGKHRANDFNPLPSTTRISSSAALHASSKYLRSPFPTSRDGDADADAEAVECQEGACAPCDQDQRQAVTSLEYVAEAAVRGSRSSVAGALRDPASRLRYSWTSTDLASTLDSASLST